VSLTTFWLSNTLIAGELPSELGSLMNLEFLIIESNNISSAIPIEIGQAITRLHELQLTNNTLTSTVPLMMGDLINLSKFD
jgi:Leucine-rich repeat (LRR) protein